MRSLVSVSYRVKNNRTEVEGVRLLKISLVWTSEEREKVTFRTRETTETHRRIVTTIN